MRKLIGRIVWWFVEDRVFQAAKAVVLAGRINFLIEDVLKEQRRITPSKGQKPKGGRRGKS